MIKNKIKISEFLKNVITLISGTVIAQAIPLAISPILTRLFSPEDFGLLALYMSIASVLAVIATGRYELAIMLPKKDEDAKKIVALSIYLSIIVSFVSLILIAVFNKQITTITKNENISIFLYFIPLSVFFISSYQVFYYWLNRQKKYMKLAQSKVVQSALTGSSNLGFGAFGFGGGLIFGSLIGQAGASIFTAKFALSKNQFFKNNKLDSILKIAKKYSDFFKYDVFASFFNVLTPQSIIFLLGALFNLALVGMYSFTFRVLLTPISVVASAIFDTFKQKATEDYNKTGSCRKIYVKTFKSLFLLSIVPFTVLFFFGTEIFSFVFGKEWSQAGEIAQVLSPMFMLKFISSPLSYTFYIANKQKQNLIGQSALFFLTAGAVYLAYHFNDTKLLFKLISVSYSLIYIVYLILSYRFSSVKTNVDEENS